jgi:hypothetical protein
MDMEEAWAFEHSVECNVAREFAWNFWTDVSNWKIDADIESVELNGPFTEGSHGTTITRSAGRIEWRIAGVKAQSEAVLEVPLPGAMGRFHWTFQDLGGHTRITQRVSIGGEQAASFAEAMAAFESGIPAGMKTLCESMVRAAAVAASAPLPSER